jgi:predicted Zn-dependent protease
VLTAASPGRGPERHPRHRDRGIIHDWSDPVFTAMGLEPDEVEILLINENDLNAFATRGRIMGSTPA